jgi:uncharacterized repeat protein (TIGR02543 family)
MGCESQVENDPDSFETVKISIFLPNDQNKPSLSYQVPRDVRFLSLIPTTELEGYTFVGYIDHRGYPITEYTTSDDSMAIYAIYTVNEHTLYFHVNGGTALSPVTFKYTEAVVPNNYIPTKENHTFAGWYKDEALTQPIGIFFAEDNDVHIYAKWTPNE